MKLLARLFALLLVCGLPGRGAAQPATAVQVNLDHAAFAYDASTSLLELYLSFEAASLPFDPAEQGFESALPLDLVLRRSTEAALPGTPSEPVWQDSLLLRFAVADTSAVQAGQQFVHQIRAVVPPGEYELSLSVPADTGRGRQALELRRDVLVPDFGAAPGVGLSDITLSTGIQQVDERDNPFYKNGLVIQPNPNQLYGQALGHLYYYVEAYNPRSVAGDDGQYTLFAYVSEANRPQPYGELQRRIERSARTPDVVVGSFDLSTLPSGAYFLRIAVLNDENESMAEQSRKFFVYNPGVVREQVFVEESFEQSAYARMTQEEVRREIDYVHVIASERERRRVRGIQDLDEQRRFLMEFWRQRDPQPGTPVNEYKDEFLQRVQYANDRYSSGREEGWKTDRGRVLIKYGTPNSVEPRLYDRDQVPHEIWQYHNIPGEGQALFVFADREGFGRFELLHSTVAGERSLPNWREELRNN